MGFDAFDRLGPFRDDNILKSGTPCDVLLSSVWELTDKETELSVDDRFQLRSEQDALRHRRQHWAAIVASAGTRYAEASLQTFEQATADHKRAVNLVTNYMGELDTGHARSLIFIGPPGTGKDHMMMAVLRYAVMRLGMVSAWADGQAWFGAVRDAYASEETETPLVNFACRSAMFGISDPIPANGAITEHQRNVLFRVIDGRYRNYRPTLATLNVATRAELDNRLGDSLADRLCEDAIVVPCNWQSYRRQSPLRVAAG